MFCLDISHTIFSPARGAAAVEDMEEEMTIEMVDMVGTAVVVDTEKNSKVGIDRAPIAKLYYLPCRE